MCTTITIAITITITMAPSPSGAPPPASSRRLWELDDVWAPLWSAALFGDAPPAASSSNVFSSASSAAAGVAGACQGHRKPGAGRVAALVLVAAVMAKLNVERVEYHETNGSCLGVLLHEPFWD